jgi:hypothetical protein
MRIPSDRIGPGDAFEFVTEFFRHEETTTPSGVDMQPEMMFFANVGDRIDRIECSENGRSGRSRHHERNLSIADALVNQSLQFFWNHLSFFIARNADAIVCSQSGSSSCAHHGKVAVFGCEHDEWTGQRLQSFTFDTWIFAVTSGQDGVQVRYGSTCAFKFVNLIIILPLGENVSLPGARIESPPLYPIISLIFLSVMCSMSMKTGEIS